MDDDTPIGVVPQIAWDFHSHGYQRGHEDGYAQGYQDAMRVLDEAGAFLAAQRPSTGIGYSHAEMEKRRHEYHDTVHCPGRQTCDGCPPRTAEQIHRQTVESWAAVDADASFQARLRRNRAHTRADTSTDSL